VALLLVVTAGWGMLLGWALTITVDRFFNPWKGEHRARY